MGLLDAPSLSKQQGNKLYPQIKPKNIATRLLTGRVANTIVNSATTTYQVTIALQQQFEAVRIIVANQYKQASFTINACGATALTGYTSTTGTTDVNSSSNVWNTVNGFTTRMAPYGNTADNSYTFSEWITCPSVARGDGGTQYLVTVRIVVQAISTPIPSYGDGIDDFTNWATKPDGNIWVARSQAGDCVTTPTAFTATTNTNGSPIIGVQYAANGQVITIASCGDSISEGRGTYKGDGFNFPAILALSNQLNIAIEYANCAWSGQAPVDFSRRAKYIMDSQIAPDILIIPSQSPNVAVPLTAAIIASGAGYRRSTMAEASLRGISVLLWTFLPVNTAVHAWGSSDALRVADNLNLTTLYANRPHTFLADLSTLYSGTPDGSGQMQINPAYTTDGIHPNDMGNAVLATAIQAQLKLMIGL